MSPEEQSKLIKGQARDIIRACVQVYTETILQIVQGDPHNWSTRPCTSCQTISSMLGKPFGCVLRAKEKSDEL